MPNPFDKFNRQKGEQQVKRSPGLVLQSRRPLTPEEFEAKHGGEKTPGPIAFEEPDGKGGWRDHWVDGENKPMPPPGEKK
jgi:hypothetical protein